MEKSTFLKAELDKQIRQEFQDKRRGYNPRDAGGRELSSYWEGGDTVLSVTWKKCKHLMYTVLHPKTYSMQEYVRFK